MLGARVRPRRLGLASLPDGTALAVSCGPSGSQVSCTGPRGAAGLKVASAQLLPLLWWERPRSLQRVPSAASGLPPLPSQSTLPHFGAPAKHCATRPLPRSQPEARQPLHRSHLPPCLPRTRLPGGPCQMLQLPWPPNSNNRLLSTSRPRPQHRSEQPSRAPGPACSSVFTALAALSYLIRDCPPPTTLCPGSRRTSASSSGLCPQA